MKKLTIILVLLCSTFNFAKTTADSLTKTNNIKKNLFSFYPFAIVGNSLAVSYERRIFSENALRLVLGFGSAEDSKYYSAKDFSEFFSELQFRIYPIKKKNDKLNYGFYLAPYLLAKTRSFTYTTYIQFPVFNDVTNKLNQNAFSGGVLVGYNLMFLERISLDLYVGGGMMTTNTKTPESANNNPINQYIKGINFHLGFNLGVSF